MFKLLLSSLKSTTRLSSTKPIIKSEVGLITQRLSCLQIASYRTESNKVSLREQQQNAFEMEQKFGIRSRCSWSKEEDDLLLKLYKKEGPQWKIISKSFVNRPAGHCKNRINLLTKKYENGPWSKQELNTLKEACGNLPPYSDKINWNKVMEALPNRPMHVIQRKYRSACDPTIKKGRWSKEESDRFEALVEQFGLNNMDHISTLMGNRSRRQCIERWRWQMSVRKKGRFTKEEDEAIMKAVEKYGENFAVVAKVIGSERTPRHISQHYHHMLAPGVDRSPWSREEELKVYQAYLDYEGNAITIKEKLQSKRSFRDIWNHITKMQKLAEKGLLDNKQPDH